MPDVNHKWEWQGTAEDSHTIQKTDVCIRCGLRRTYVAGSTSARYAPKGTVVFKTLRPIPECDSRPRSERGPL